MLDNGYMKSELNDNFFELYPISYYDNGTVKIAYRDIFPLENTISATGFARPVILLHGFPYDIYAYTQVSQVLLAHGYRVIVPYLRGYGPSQYSHANSIRSGQQGALAADLFSLLQKLQLSEPILAGFDWGGRASCIVAALYPEIVHGLVTADGYNIFDHAHSDQPLPPEDDYRYWYQWYFNTERGRKGLEKYRTELCHFIWKLWSPSWNFSAETYALTAQSFENPDFVETVISSYRHRYRADPGDPQYDEIESQLALQPEIHIPTINVSGADDGVNRAVASLGLDKFTHLVDNIILPGCGHNIPQERPREFANAILRLA